ncbi:putative folate-biopterin transporter chloroplastic-like [Trifolium pratense]|uniref:Putative folate-biopterin transporter chloroplastic-like n=1 Tax=Trifolium pratense TaxID=57577 RepID=A0A2K3N2T2_TRIPR|nr:putative folate-biopterin transporter chloroplastic-like [Trifolium pratense]PNX94733.1 putative folate-biopterin transporter chloroplastic-like [Trifolium pratense]PNX97299.1 putative folate-biopterin transporter chloroplastic-like [Trifolium pratense]PNY16593.1 putative folate-biopterin transporter chloroplastic-like [Trifolium pratense]
MVDTHQRFVVRETKKKKEEEKGVLYEKEEKKIKGTNSSTNVSQIGSKQMLILCGFGYWLQGFRCFPWLALNFHMASNLNLDPSILQLVQYSANLPMVAKPLYGILSDVIYIGGAHRIPYIVIGDIVGYVDIGLKLPANLDIAANAAVVVQMVLSCPFPHSIKLDNSFHVNMSYVQLASLFLLQIFAWNYLAFVPAAREVLTILVAAVLLSNLGASITEVAKDALVAEYGKKQKIGGLQSYAFMALAAGGILGNMIGGYFLLKLPPRIMFIIFSSLLSLQLAISFSTREDSLGIPQPSSENLATKSISENIRKQASDLFTAISDKSISRPLLWIVGSIAMVPMLTGSVFCYQTQCLNLDPMIIGWSRVIGQLMLFSGTVLYNRFWKKFPMRNLIGAVQILYASSLLLDLVLVQQINLKFGIPNEVFAPCFSGLAEVLAQFKLLPFSVLFASLCPKGCEGSLTSFLASALILSSIVSGFLGVGLASLLGITSGNYSGLTVGILIQFVAALLPLKWISSVPMSQPDSEKQKRKSMSRRARRNRRVGKVVIGSINAYRREREWESQR